MANTNLANELEQHTRAVRRHAARRCVTRTLQEAEANDRDPDVCDCMVEPLGGCNECMEAGRAKVGPPPGTAVDRLALVMGWQDEGKEVCLYAPTSDRLCMVLSVGDDLYDFNLSELVTAAVRPGDPIHRDEPERIKLVAVCGDGSWPIRCGGLTMSTPCRIILYAAEHPVVPSVHVDVDALIRLALRPVSVDPEEGGPCPDGCGGTLELPPPENCSCHIAPPCSECTDRVLTCSKCGWEAV